MNKVMMINGSASPLKCGVGYYGEMLVPELAKNNDVHVLTSKGLGDDIKGATKVHHTDNWKIAQLVKITSLVKQIKPGVVHIQYPALGYKRELGINLLPLWMRVFHPKTPVIVTLHEYHESAGLGKTRNLITLLFAKKIIVSNKLDVDSLPSFLKKKVTIIPIGSTIKTYPKNKETFSKLLRGAEMSPNNPVLAYFGFINPNKGVETLVRAAKDINAQILLLAELKKDNPYHLEIESLIDNAKKEGVKIHVAGFLENEQLSQILQDCLFFVLPQPLPLTAKSSTAIVALEHGLPVISKSSSNPEYNYPYVNNKNAVLLGEMNERTLAEACNDLLTNLEKLKLLKAENIKLESYFSWDSIAEKHIKLYDSLV